MPVSVPDNAHAIRHANAQRMLPADDAITSIHPALGMEEVHGATLP